MNAFLWTIQLLLALHTAVGALWKFSHSSRQTMPSLAAIPHGLWLALAFIELLCVIGFIVPAFSKRLAVAAPIAAALVIAEMLLFTVVHQTSGSAGIGPVIYWLVVALVCGIIVYGRLVRTPVRRNVVLE